MNVLKVVEVMHIGCCHIIGMYDTRRATKGMKLIAVVVHVLRGTIAPGWGMVHVSLAHRAPFGKCVLAHLDGLGVYAAGRRRWEQHHGEEHSHSRLLDFLQIVCRFHGFFGTLQ